MYWFILSFFLCFSGYAKETSEAFVVTAFDDRIKVLAPATSGPGLHVIVENRSLVNLVGKVQTGKGRVLGFVSLPSNGFKTIPLDLGPGERVYFVSMAPGFQEVELVVGKNSYEIPPQR